MRKGNSDWTYLSVLLTSSSLTDANRTALRATATITLWWRRTLALCVASGLQGLTLGFFAARE